MCVLSSTDESHTHTHTRRIWIIRTNLTQWRMENSSRITGRPADPEVHPERLTVNRRNRQDYELINIHERPHLHINTSSDQPIRGRLVCVKNLNLKSDSFIIPWSQTAVYVRSELSSGAVFTDPPTDTRIFESFASQTPHSFHELTFPWITDTRKTKKQDTRERRNEQHSSQTFQKLPEIPQ